ncbi:MAG TPA: MBL fold metallo-hydrolase [Thermomicrobiaceae bacterium]|nr:MBL fold metallo-hydrolase [Thermomicrobiaceae bacterium]
MSTSMSGSTRLADYVDQRRIGDATVTVISEGSLVWPPKFPVAESEWRAAMPEANEAGEVKLGLNLAHVRLGDASIMIDPGCDDPGSAWQQGFARRFKDVTRTPGLARALELIGERPDEITHVLITHGHGDHFAGTTVEHGDELVARFPNARHYIGRADWEGNPYRERPDSEIAMSLGTIDRLGLLETVDREREIVPGVTMVPAPGESPGHSVVRVRTGGGSFYYLGDLFHHACEVSHPDWVSPGRDQAAMRASRDWLFADAGTEATLVFAHEGFPGWGHFVLANGGYRWELG